jgi:hypothetical protein
MTSKTCWRNILYHVLCIYISKYRQKNDLHSPDCRKFCICHNTEKTGILDFFSCLSSSMQIKPVAFLIVFLCLMWNFPVRWCRDSHARASLFGIWGYWNGYIFGTIWPSLSVWLGTWVSCKYHYLFQCFCTESSLTDWSSLSPLDQFPTSWSDRFECDQGSVRMIILWEVCLEIYTRRLRMLLSPVGVLLGTVRANCALR